MGLVTGWETIGGDRLPLSAEALASGMPREYWAGFERDSVSRAHVIETYMRIV